MNILMVHSMCNISTNLKKGLEKLGHKVTIVGVDSPFEDEKPDITMNWKDILHNKYGDDYDIVYLHSPNFKKCLAIQKYIGDKKLVCHWHGSDLRIWRKSFPIRTYMLWMADAHIYSTIDLAWWIKRDMKFNILPPVDTEQFKPNKEKKMGTVIFDGGGKALEVHKIPHKFMPEYLNKFEKAEIHNAYGLSDKLMSVIALECLACGLKVEQFPNLNREWVVKNASVDVIAKKTEKILEDVIDENKDWEIQSLLSESNPLYDRD